MLTILGIANMSYGSTIGACKSEKEFSKRPGF